MGESWNVCVSGDLDARGRSTSLPCVSSGEWALETYLIEGLSGGKTSVCDELQRRGYQAIHGDRELAYQGEPETVEPTDSLAHQHHIWHVER
jgi:hypothetical protein